MPKSVSMFTCSGHANKKQISRMVSGRKFEAVLPIYACNYSIIRNFSIFYFFFHVCFN